jgi:hypothetical protein
VRSVSFQETENLRHTILHQFLLTASPQLSMSTHGAVLANGDLAISGTLSASASATGPVTHTATCEQCNVPLHSAVLPAAISSSALTSSPSSASSASEASSSPILTSLSCPASLSTPSSTSPSHSPASVSSTSSSATTAAKNKHPAETDSCGQLVPHLSLSSLWDYFTQRSAHTFILNGATAHFKPSLSALCLYGKWIDPYYFDCGAAREASAAGAKHATAAPKAKLFPFSLEFVENGSLNDRPAFSDSIINLLKLKQSNGFLRDACLHNVDRVRSWLAVAWHRTGSVYFSVVPCSLSASFSRHLSNYCSVSHEL